MPGYSLEIGDGTAKRSDVMHCAHLFGINVSMQMPHLASRSVPQIARQVHIHAEPRDATHTDPQILFWAATP
jgi:hypothetical protein